MPLPRIDHAYIPEEKLTGYLLSETHAVGKAKAKFFLAHGYDAASSEQLARDLLEIARSNPVEQEVVSPHGTKYLVSGILKTPGGTTVAVRTVWIVEPGDERPRFVTAYPRWKWKS